MFFPYLSCWPPFTTVKPIFAISNSIFELNFSTWWPNRIFVAKSDLRLVKSSVFLRRHASIHENESKLSPYAINKTDQVTRAYYFVNTDSGVQYQELITLFLLRGRMNNFHWFCSGKKMQRAIIWNICIPGWTSRREEYAKIVLWNVPYRAKGEVLGRPRNSGEWEEREKSGLGKFGK